MLRWALRIACALFVLGLLSFFTWIPKRVDANTNGVAPPERTEVSLRAVELHADSTVIDLHADSMLWGRDLLRRQSRGHVDLPRLAEGNVALQVFSAVTKAPAAQNYQRTEDIRDRVLPLVVAQRWPPRTWWSLEARAAHQAARLHRFARRSGGALLVVESREDLERLEAERVAGGTAIGGLLAIEGLHALEGDLSAVDRLFAAGYRMMGLAHFFDTEVSGSAHGVEQYGLTELGRQVVDRMEELGIVVDLAHTSPRAIDEVLDRVSRPVVVSHTGVRGTCPSPRNLSDRHLDRIAANGGVIGIGFFAGAVCDTEPRAIVAAMRYVAERIGVEHVALGSDFDGTVVTPFDAAGLARLTDELLAAGFSETETRAILGENVLRVLRATLPEDSSKGR